MASVYSAGDFRNGLTLEMDNNIYQIIEFQHVKPGKGAAFVRTKLKNIINVETIIGQVVYDSIKDLFDNIEVVYQSLIEKKDLQNIFNTSLIQKNHNKNRM